MNVRWNLSSPSDVYAHQKLQEMDEQRIRHLAEGYCQFSDIEKKVLPIISKCLEGITAAGNKIDAKQVKLALLLKFCKHERLLLLN